MRRSCILVVVKCRAIYSCRIGLCTSGWNCCLVDLFQTMEKLRGRVKSCCLNVFCQCLWKFIVIVSQVTVWDVHIHFWTSSFIILEAILVYPHIPNYLFECIFCGLCTKTERQPFIWNPCLIHVTGLLESVHQTFMKWVLSSSRLIYVRRLVVLEVIDSLTLFDHNTVFIQFKPPSSLHSHLPVIQKPTLYLEQTFFSSCL